MEKLNPRAPMYVATNPEFMDVLKKLVEGDDMIAFTSSLVEDENKLRHIISASSGHELGTMLNYLKALTMTLNILKERLGGGFFGPGYLVVDHIFENSDLKRVIDVRIEHKQIMPFPDEPEWS